MGAAGVPLRPMVMAGVSDDGIEGQAKEKGRDGQTTSRSSRCHRISLT